MNEIWNFKNFLNYYGEKNIEQIELREFQNTNDILNLEENASYRFNIAESIFYAGGYLYQELQIVNNDGTSIGNKKVTLENFGGLLNTSELKVNGDLIEKNEFTNFKMHTNALIHFTPDYSTSEATNMFCYIDTSDTADTNLLKSIQIIDTTKLKEFFDNLDLNEEYNEGFAKRYFFTKNSKSVHILTPLKRIFNFINDYQKVFSKDFEFQFLFDRNKNNDMIYTNEPNPTYKVLVKKLSLFLPYIKFKAAIKSDYLELLKSPEKITIPWCHSRVEKSNPLRTREGVISLKGTTDEVLSIYFIAQYNERENNQSKNSLIFNDIEIVKYHFEIGGVEFPPKQHNTDFGNFHHNIPYQELQILGLNNIGTETGCLMDYLKFGKLHRIICVDTSYHEKIIAPTSLDILFHYELKSAPNKDYHFKFIINERKKCILDIGVKTIKVDKTL